MASRPRYLVIVPPDLQRTAALFRAMALAKETQAEIALVLFDFDPVLAKAQARGFSIAAYLDGRRHELEQFTTHLRLEGFKVRAEVRWGSPFIEQLLAEVARLKPDLVIKDVQAEGPLKRLLLTGRDFELLRHCPAPLMLVKSGNHNLPGHIMAAVDPLDENNRPHELNARILGAAEKYGMVTGASVDVVHVFQPLPVMASAAGLGGTGWAPDHNLVQMLRNEHERALQALGKEYGVQERHLHMLDGFPGSALAKFSETYHIDLVVMGTVSRRSMDRLMLGSVAEDLFQRLSCDVLAVK